MSMNPGFCFHIMKRWPRPLQLSFIILFGLLGGSSAKQHFYGFCFRTIAEADVNGDFALDPNEFTSFSFAYTRGVAKRPLPQDLVNVFISTADQTAMLLSVPGVKDDASPEDVASTSKLCYTINLVIQKLLRKQVSSQQCMGSLGTADQDAPKGQLSSDEYITALRALTGDPYDQVTTLDDLDILAKSVFLDMEIEGYITGGAGAEYLGEFCLRAIIAQGLDSIANKLYPDTAVKPTGTAVATSDAGSTSPSTNSTQVTTDDTAEDTPKATSVTNSSSTEGSYDTPTSNVTTTETGDDEETEDGESSVEMDSNLLEKCRLAMLFIDKDRDNLLDKNEFGMLVDRLKTEIVGGLSYRQESDIYDAQYDIMVDTFGGPPSLQGSKPTQVASAEDAETLKAICQGTYEAMEAAKNPSGSVGDGDVLVKQNAMDDVIELEPEVLKECKRSIYVSDRDRNGGLDVDEFIFLLNRLDGDETYAFVGFGDLDDVFHEIYKDLSSYSGRTNSFMVSSLGSKPGTIATGDETAHLDAVCEAVVYALKEVSI